MDVVWWNVFLQNICHLIGKLRITEALLKPSPLPMYHLNRYKFYLMYPSTIKEKCLDWCRQPRCSDPTTAAAETKSRFRVSIPTPTESSCWLKRLLFLLLLSKRMNITHMYLICWTTTWGRKTVWYFTQCRNLILIKVDGTIERKQAWFWELLFGAPKQKTLCIMHEGNQMGD